MQVGPVTAFSNSLYNMKYCSPGEAFREAINRIAFGLKDSDDHYHKLRNVLLPQRFLPAGRIQAAVGSSKWVTLFNCFVSGTISDSFVDGPGSIMDRAKEAAATMRMGGGIGYDFSTLRPRGEMIAKLQSQSSGPIAFMDIFDAICRTICSAGHRRGAQMGILRIDHPDIEELIHAKNNQDKLTGFNISIAVTDEFMECLLEEKEFPLKWGGKVYRYVDANTLWEKIMRSTFDWAEPGILFIDTINKMNNLYYCEQIAATNPCSEQALPPFGACLLGSFNLVKYLSRQPVRLGNNPWSFDFDQLTQDIPIVVRALDNAIDRARYPLAEQRAEASTKRRMGLGVTGLANTAEAMGYTYGSASFLEFEEQVLDKITEKTYRASADLAAEKGSFPLYDEQRYNDGKFINTLSEETRYRIKKHGIRNSHLTSVAPTGTISLAADNVSSAIEPVFSYETTRNVYTPSGVSLETIKDYGHAFLGVKGKLAKDVTADEHIAVLATAQKYVDSACSKTINMDGKVMSWAEFKMIYQDAWQRGCKGVATFNISGKRMSLLTAAEPEPKMEEIEGASCEFDLATGRRSCE